MKPFSRQILLVLLGSLGCFAGCATPAQTADQTKKPAAQEYEYVYDTGSNIPRRVPKGQKKKPAVGSNVMTADGEVLQDFDRSAKTHNPSVGGAK